MSRNFYDAVVMSLLFPFLRHEMQYFVHKLEGYLSNQIVNVTWPEFQEGLLNVGNLGMI